MLVNSGSAHCGESDWFEGGGNSISHYWAENTADDDIVLGAQVFADAIARVLKG